MAFSEWKGKKEVSIERSMENKNRTRLSFCEDGLHRRSVYIDRDMENMLLSVLRRWQTERNQDERDVKKAAAKMAKLPGHTRYPEQKSKG